MANDDLQNTIKKLSAGGIFSQIDLHFARFIDGFSDNRDPSVFLAAALTSRATAAGDICLDLESISDAELSEETSPLYSAVIPELHAWRQSLMAHPAIGSPGDRMPLILDDHNRLYLCRYWQYETDLLSTIKARTQGQLTDFDPARANSSLSRLFPADDEQVDWQKIAAVTGLLKRFCVITGGPGTGKTYAIAGILALLQECAGRKNSIVRLAAPTGKAAARLGESLLQAKKNLNCSRTVKDTIPDEVFTIHRLLQPIAGTPYFRYNSNNYLPADVVVVDEASMVDLALMTKLLQAVPADARLLIVGDKDQLASVEAGSVLGDICDRETSHGFSKAFLKQVLMLTGLSGEQFNHLSTTGTPLQDCICVLQKNYRFSSRSGIGAISHAINQGDIERSLDLLKNPSETTVEWQAVSTPEELGRKLVPRILEGYRKYLTIQDPVLAMGAFNQFKILCALKIGPFGVQAINLLAEQALARENLITVNSGMGFPWYRGRPVMITQNSYNLGLYNGDIGITLPDPQSADDQLMVYFQDASGGVRRFLPHRLPEHETVYAMTVHKSQGSEFNQVFLILPDRDYPLLTRELIYTGLTRARKKISIWGKETVVRTAISRKIERSSGLREGLWDRRVKASGFKVK
jgi:exodeoxyribonuclease V alpha subunit